MTAPHSVARVPSIYKLQAPVVAILTRASVLSRQHAPLFFEKETTLADVDTLKCAAVRTLRRRTKAPLLLLLHRKKAGGSLPRARDRHVCPCSRDLGSFARFFVSYYKPAMA